VSSALEPGRLIGRERLLDRQAEPPLAENQRCIQVAQNMQRRRGVEQKVIDDNYAYEQATVHRRPPASTPPLPAHP
jgi:hypothetical protein